MASLKPSRLHLAAVLGAGIPRPRGRGLIEALDFPRRPASEHPSNLEQINSALARSGTRYPTVARGPPNRGVKGPGSRIVASREDERFLGVPGASLGELAAATICGLDYCVRPLWDVPITSQLGPG